MKLRFLFAAITFISFLNVSVAQQTDTLRLMTYNLLNYRNTTSFCTNSNNSPATKENALEIIVDHVLPDILVCNEVGGSPNGFNAFTLMNSALNKNGKSYYQMANYTAGFNPSLTNMLYYNSNKLVLESQSTVDRALNNVSLVRLIDIYTLYYNDPNLANHNDTTRFHIIAAHLKAGNTTSDRNERAQATEAVMAYLDTINATGNYFFMGDLNVYRATEACFLDLVAYSPDPNLNFFDPANAIGNWSNNSSFASVHTQSTRTSGNGCASGGGMDDRFDFILASDEVMNNVDKVEYISGSYKALGQDGNRFNQSINSPTNNTAPFFVINALRDLSDHLPVMMDVKVTLPNTIGLTKLNFTDYFKMNTICTDELRLNALSDLKLSEIQILNANGQLMLNEKLIKQTELVISVSHIPKGHYYVKIITENNQQFVEKLIKI